MPNANDPDPLDRQSHSNPAGDSPHSDPWKPFEERLTRALEAAPQFQIPANFAARVTARLPPRAPGLDAVTLSATHYGRSAILIALAVLLAAMLILAAHTATQSQLETIFEGTLCAQFVALTIWFSTSHKGAN